MKAPGVRGSLCVLSVALASCAGGESATGPHQLRDSAGVRIAENLGPIWTEVSTWTLSAEPVVRIGALEGEPAYLFDRIRGLVVLADGRIVVSNGGTNTIRWFDPAGRFLFERGGEGDGPGEFRGVGQLTVTAGDTILASDSRTDRLALFASDGAFLAGMRLLGLPSSPGRVFRISDGSFVVGSSGFSSVQLGDGPRPEGHRRFPTPIVHVSAEGASADTIGLFPGLEMRFRVDEQGRSSFGPHPYGKSLVYGVRDDRVHVGTAESFTIDVFSAEGALLRSVRAPDVDQTIDPVQAAKTLRAMLEGLPEYRAATAEERAEADADLEDDVRSFPPTRPAYSGLLIDELGFLWVGEHHPDTRASRRWAVFDPEGRFVGSLAMPTRFTPLAISADRVLGRSEDELGVQYVSVYALTR
jgi:hypothetical protein